MATHDIGTTYQRPDQQAQNDGCPNRVKGACTSVLGTRARVLSGILHINKKPNIFF